MRTIPASPTRFIRVFLPAALILVWLAAASFGGPLFGKISEVSSNDQTTYLPASADATAVQETRRDFAESEAIPAIAIFTGDVQLSAQELDDIGAALDRVANLEATDGDVSPPLPSEDGLAAQAFVPVSTDADLADAIDDIRSVLLDTLPEGITAQITGPAGFSADLVAGFAGIDGLLLGVALAAVLVILILVYRSFLLPAIVLSTSVFALCTALLVVWWLAKVDALLLTGQTQGILFILVIGAATDYALLLVARFRDELRTEPDHTAALRRALRASIEPILASGSTVIAGLLCLLLSDLRSNSSLGPVAAIGIAFAMLAALTLLPSLLLLLGRSAFWPRVPRPGAPGAAATAATAGVWAGAARLVSRRPRRVWIGTTIVLAIGCLGITQLDASGVAQSDLVLGASEARDGQQALGEHFPGGSGSPAEVLTPEDDVPATVSVLTDHPGVSSVAVLTADAPGGSAPIDTDGTTSPVGPPGTPAPDPTVVDGRVMLQATLSNAADSASAEATVRDLRIAVPDSVLIGGVTATAIDTNDASIHDRNLIIPVVLVVILVILALLLRSILAPVLLIATTVLSFGTAMGVSGVLFTHVLGFPGADPAVPLYGFVFLVALGIDYNIFLMTRVREESKIHGTRDGILRGLTSTGGVITSAGIVLAATFAALGVIPVLFLAQLAFIVAFGVLLDTFVVRTLLVPALAYDIGHRVWWPARMKP
ncbi:MMPL family transporter [Microbacterium amylolyticum]|uniref:RND superfamily putative drug exporter n=1 Tax=Microbacterium amylolyticum TaxID=936337 RepID=A0ABS4ZIJ6_9MICO|nr:efflux RND transporter permease subunit [Microbacterium amylolyticum]MBP2436878.1 RND superfamily putative drug exporter [Microbacterium amylolyticum]